MSRPSVIRLTSRFGYFVPFVMQRVESHKTNIKLRQGLAQYMGFPYRQVEGTENPMRFRPWLKNEFGIIPLEDAGAFIAGAKAKHPELGAWVRDWQKKHFAR